MVKETCSRCWGYQPARQTLEAVANQPVQNRQSHASLSVKIRET